MKWMRVFTLIVALIGAAILLAACGDDDEDGAGGEATQTAAATTAEGDSAEEVELELTADNVQFDKDTLEAPAGAEVSLTLENKDTVQHSFSLFETEESDEALFKGETFAGPSFLTYQFTAPDSPGTYHFHCDVHPEAMQGDFVVE